MQPGSRLGQLLLQAQRVEPVGGDAADHHRHRAAAQRRGDPAAAAADVVAGQRLGQRHVAAGVETRHQLVALVLQVALHRVAAAASRILVALGVVGEPGVELHLAAVGQVGEAAGDAPARRRGCGRCRDSRRPASSGRP